MPGGADRRILHACPETPMRNFAIACLCFAPAAALPALTSCFKRQTNVQTGDRDHVLHRGIGADPTDLMPIGAGMAKG